MGKYSLTAALFMVSCIGPAYSGSHTHYFFTTAIIQPEHDVSLYFTTRNLDDIILYKFDNTNELLEILVCWFKVYNASLRAVNELEYGYQSEMFDRLNNITNQLNETDGVHILQRIEGCELHDNGTLSVTYRDAYNGKPFLTFNADTTNWTAEVPEAQYLVDVENQTENEETKDFLERACSGHIKELLILGQNFLDRKEPPGIHITQRSASRDIIVLECRAYGHYPKDILMVWERNGQQMTDGGAEILTLPLTDQTYLSVLSVNITTTEEDTYTCLVTHNSTERPIRSQWRASNVITSQGQGISVGVVIAICLAVLLGVIVVVFGFLSWQRSRSQ